MQAALSVAYGLAALCCSLLLLLPSAS